MTKFAVFLHDICAPPQATSGNPSDEMDHRLAIEVARALGPAAMLRAFTPDNLRWLCRGCHRRKTGQDRRLAKFLSACSLDWYSAQRLLLRHHTWLQSFLLPCSLELAPLHRASTASRPLRDGVRDVRWSGKASAGGTPSLHSDS